ncbi:MAG: anaerobic ribonucleoside-triphosphate reductase [Planctomycetota bacterium]
MAQVASVSRVSKVVNRNGEVVPFRRNRVVRAILAAVRSAGSKDEWVADKLTDMVVYFLDVHHGGNNTPPTAADVDDMIEKALLSSPELSVIATAFIDGRKQQLEISQLEENFSAERSGPKVAQPLEGLGDWNPARIAAAIMREQKVDKDIATEVANAVAERVKSLNLPTVTTGLIRELADVELLSRGVISEPGTIAVPRFDIDQWLFPANENADSPLGTASDLMRRTSAQVLSEYTLTSILPASGRDAHQDGSLHFWGLSNPAAIQRLHLNADLLLDTGAGLGNERLYGQHLTSLSACMSRCSEIVREAARFTSAQVSISGLDRALGRFTTDEATEFRATELVDGLSHLAEQTPQGVTLQVGPPTSGAQDLISHVLLNELASDNGRFREQIRLQLSLNAGAFADDARRALIERAADVAVFCGVPTFAIPSFGSGGSGLFDTADARHRVLLAGCGLNLVRPALDLKPGDTSRYLASLDATLEAAIQGLSARASFLERVAMRDIADPVLAGVRLFRVLVGSSRNCGLVPHGIWTAASLLAESETERNRVVQQILSYLQFKSSELARSAGIEVQLLGTADESGTAKFTRCDSALVSQKDIDSPLRAKLLQDDCYDTGTSSTAGTVEDRLQREAPLHNLFASDLEFVIDADERPSADGLMTLLRECVRPQSTRPHLLRISAPEKTCTDCNTTYAMNSDQCPTCGSERWTVPQGQRNLFE